MQVQKSDLERKPMQMRPSSVGLLALIESRRVQKVLCVVDGMPGGNLVKALENHERLMTAIADHRPVELVRDIEIRRNDYADDIDVEQIPIAVAQAIGVPTKTVGRVFKSVHYLCDDGQSLGSRTPFLADVAIISSEGGYRLLRGPQYPAHLPVLLD